MPVPGVARNPLGETPTRFTRNRIVFVAVAGRTPGLMDVDLRADTAAPGTIRRVWEQAVNYIAGPPPFSTTANAFDPHVDQPGGITRAKRYKASSLYRPAGNNNTRFGAPRPLTVARHQRMPITIAAGNKQSRPTIRNRMTSFGKRVPPLNNPSPAAEQSSS